MELHESQAKKCNIFAPHTSIFDRKLRYHDEIPIAIGAYLSAYARKCASCIIVLRGSNRCRATAHEFKFVYGRWRWGCNENVY